MIPRRRAAALLAVLALGAAFPGTPAGAAPAGAAPSCRADVDLDVTFEAAPDARLARRFADRLRDAVRAVCAWWGPTYDGPFRVVVQDRAGPSMALLPAWRGDRGALLFSAPAVARDRAATVHEVTHVFAPNGNRFLAEGLAVFAHAALGGPPAFPNFGADLDALARGHARTADLAALDRLATPSRLSLPGLDERDAYVVAGSFVRFLVDRFGIERFRALYALTPLTPGRREAGASGRWAEVYGLSLAALALEWRRAIGAGAP